MEPSSVVPNTAERQIGGKHHNTCCQATPGANCASAQATADAEAAEAAEAAVPAVPAMPAVPSQQCECAGTKRPAEQAGDAEIARPDSAEHAVPAVPQYMLRQSVALAADADARTLCHTVSSSDNPALQASQASDIHSHPNGNVSPVNAEQKQTTQIPDRTKSQSNSGESGIAEAAGTSPADSLQHQDAVGGMAEGRAAPKSPGVRGHIAGYTWTLPAGMRQEDCAMMWIGPSDAAALTHLQLTFNK